MEQASAEVAASMAQVQDGNTRWVATVLNKGAAFLDLLTCCDEAHTLVQHVR